MSLFQPGSTTGRHPRLRNTIIYIHDYQPSLAPEHVPEPTLATKGRRVARTDAPSGKQGVPVRARTRRLFVSNAWVCARK